MQKHAFKMRLNPGREEEYRKRHDEIWPELVILLKEAGVSDYSIHLVGQKYGMIPEDASSSIAKIQNELAVERIQPDQEFRRFIWMPRPMVTDDERQQEFITELQEDL